MALFNNNKQEKNEPRRIVGGFLGHPKDNSNAGPVLRDVVSKEGNVIKLGNSLKKPIDSPPKPAMFPPANSILEIKKEAPYKKLELTKKNVLIPSLARRTDSAKKMRFIS